MSILRSLFPPHQSLVLVALALLMITPAAGQLIQISGNGQTISNGDTTPSSRDHTNFGPVLAGSGPVDRNFLIRNLSQVPLQILFFQRTGTHPGNFTITAPPEPVIPGNGEASITVRFIPPAAGGLRSATIRLVTTSSIDGDFQFDIAGELILPAPNIIVLGNDVVIPDGAFSPLETNNTDFGTLTLEDPPRTHTFSLQNDGDQTLRIGGLSVTGINSDQFAISREPATFVPPGSETSFDIRFNPDREGAHRVTILINSNDPSPTERTYSFTLRGTGVSQYPGIALTGNGLKIRPGKDSPRPENYTQFPEADLQAISTRVFMIENTGDATLTISGIQILGPHGAEFTTSDTPPVQIDPAGIFPLQIHFRPTEQGVRIADLQITSNDPSTPVFEVSLEGLGGRFKLLGVERTAEDTIITFTTRATPGTYIYRILYSSDLETWDSVGSIFSGGMETLQFRHRGSSDPPKGFWRVEEDSL
ncbi:MAG TPA: hypothetical protein DD438_00055 [Verrucomicrobiales bacterium]|nr:hypothetical protein [Verrucomicrobiales bacterium]HCQ38937.1 hypothetical protein [Verrucomicrobiales bacterium]